MRLFLIGFMASGKSFWGQKLAKALNLQYLDLDKEIEKFTDSTIPEIFKNNGESEFRKIESFLLDEGIRKHEKYVMACGGGVMQSEKNRRLIKGAGISVYVDTDIDIIIHRLLQDAGNRPLLVNLSQDALRKKVESMMKERRSVYETADIIFKSELETLNDLVKKISLFSKI
jgi:shikimate kinase